MANDCTFTRQGGAWHLVSSDCQGGHVCQTIDKPGNGPWSDSDFSSMLSRLGATPSSPVENAANGTTITVPCVQQVADPNNPGTGGGA